MFRPHLKEPSSPFQLTYEHGQKTLALDPLTGEIEPDKSDYRVGKMKVEVRRLLCFFFFSSRHTQVRLAKTSPGRWGRLVRGPNDEQGKWGLFSLSPRPALLTGQAVPKSFSSSSAPSTRRAEGKNWEKVSDTILKGEKDKTMQEDPNAVDSNHAFSELFQHLDEDARRAMLKSYTESGGTTLSTDWNDVKKGPVPIRPPEGQEWKKWG